MYETHYYNFKSLVFLFNNFSIKHNNSLSGLINELMYQYKRSYKKEDFKNFENCKLGETFELEIFTYDISDFSFCKIKLTIVKCIIYGIEKFCILHTSYVNDEGIKYKIHHPIEWGNDKAIIEKCEN